MALRGHHWGDVESLLALVVDRLGILAAEARLTKVPDPLQRPWDEPADTKSDRVGRVTPERQADAIALLDSLAPPTS